MLRKNPEEFTKLEPLLMIPGPTESASSVLSSKRALGHTEEAFISTFKRALSNIRDIFGTNETYSPVIIGGAGTLAMEIAAINLIKKEGQTKAIVFSTGYFGTRFQDLLNSFGVNTILAETTVGEKFSFQQYKEELNKHSPDLAFIQHVDTSSGVANNIAEFAKACNEKDVISIVDGVCSVGGERVYQEKWGIDVYFTGAQKAIACPPGLAILNYSPKARTFIENNEDRLPMYYSDLSRWWPILDAYDSGSVKYFSTPATNLIHSLRVATDNMLEEGMEVRNARHDNMANSFRDQLNDLNFSFLTSKNSFANTLSTPKYLDASQGADFRKNMLESGVLIAGGIQSGYAGEYFRVGHMGNISEFEINYTIEAIKKSI